MEGCDAMLEITAFYDSLAPIRYVDDQHNITEVYPFNPNGSPEGIASLCTPDGRHLAIMPHPERFVLNKRTKCMSTASSIAELLLCAWLSMLGLLLRLLMIL